MVPFLGLLERNARAPTAPGHRLFHGIAFFLIFRILYAMVIRMRHTRAHTKNRRAHHKATAGKIAIDKETNTPHLRHRVSLETGKYRGKQVLTVVKSSDKKSK